MSGVSRRVSVETVHLVNELAVLVKAEDWLDEEVNLNESELGILE